VLDYIEAASERLVVYRIKEPTSACRAMADVIVKTSEAMDRAIRCLRHMDPRFHEHAVEVNRLENAADDLLRMWGQGLVHPVVGATFPLAEAAEAHRLVEERRSTGKVVLVP